MNSKNYLAYRKNVEKNLQPNFDNLVVGEILYTEKGENSSIIYNKVNKKFIFQKVEMDSSIKYREVFSGMIFNKLEGHNNSPYIINEEELLNYIDLNNTDITMLNLVEISDQINEVKKNKKNLFN
ncbi:MAG: hypothetical protein E7160_01960 [Firmicutes bacterium]|nr:hypothetical protein [Bacillota bacterium]